MKRLVLATTLCLGIGHAAAADLHAHHHAPAPDNRAVLKLTPDERAMLLEEMHLFLAGVGKITEALARSDMAAVAATARPLGPQMAQTMPASLRAKLPMEFRQIAGPLHADFGQIALDAETMKDVSHTLAQVSTMLQKCSSCHAAFQIRVVDTAEQH